MAVFLTGSGLYTPTDSVSNAELVAAFNQNADQNGKELSDADFIVKASGIQNRFLMDKSGVVDPNRMKPLIATREDTQLSLQAEMGIQACEQALASAGRTGAEIDAVIVACSNMQRPYPAMAIEIQHALGAQGFAFDLNVACSSATFGLTTAKSLIDSKQASRVLVVSPEICSAHLDFTDRDSHFIFGDAATAMVLESEPSATNSFEVQSTKLLTVFSNNIRNNGGFLTRCEPDMTLEHYPLFKQNGRKVFKEVVPMVVNLINEHLAVQGIESQDIKRLWLHQANSNMNRLIATKVLGVEPLSEQAPQILDEYANTSSAGSVIAFHKYHTDLVVGDTGVLCSFGAGYSIGSVILRKCA